VDEPSKSEPVELVRRFGQDMKRGVAELCRLGYDATLFQRMLGEHGPVEAVRRLVLDPKPSYGLWRLQQLKRLDASAEMGFCCPGTRACSPRRFATKRSGSFVNSEWTSMPSWTA
jgi:hypothetical protein